MTVLDMCDRGDILWERPTMSRFLETSTSEGILNTMLFQ